MNQTRKITTVLLLLLLALSVAGKDKNPATGNQSNNNNKNANRVYRIIVNENNENSPLTLKKSEGDRGFIGDAFKMIRQSYSSTIMGQLTSVSSDILSVGIGLLVDKLRSHNPDWMAQVKKDCTFTKTIPMPQEIANFYKTTSKNGSTDPDSIIFDGFGCQQYIQYTDNDSIDNAGNIIKVDHLIEHKIPVFDIRCSLRKDDVGKGRMLQHGKFEVLVDYVYVNPMFCDLPNDSLTSDKIDLQTPFGFDKRQNLRLNVNAVITSSWMNQATQIYNDQQLGEFSINICIPDSSALEKDGPFKDCFVYVRPDKRYMDSLGWNYDKYAKQMEGKQVSVTGESFLVPRSFIGTDNLQTYSRTWGTGQYKVNMTLTETCDVRMGYYCTLCHEAEMKMRMEHEKMKMGMGNYMAMGGNMGPGMSMHKGNHKWNNRWGEEWKKMKKRHKNKKFFAGIWDNIKVNYQNYNWVYTMLTPVANAFIEQENKYVGQQLSKWFKLGDNLAAGGATISMPNNGQKGGGSQGGTPQGGQGGGSQGGTTQSGQGGAPQGGGQFPPK